MTTSTSALPQINERIQKLNTELRLKEISCLQLKLIANKLQEQNVILAQKLQILEITCAELNKTVIALKKITEHNPTQKSLEDLLKEALLKEIIDKLIEEQQK
jgi:hypothetical protein